MGIVNYKEYMRKKRELINKIDIKSIFDNDMVTDLFDELEHLFALSMCCTEQHCQSLLCSKFLGCISECYKFGIGIKDSDSKYASSLLEMRDWIDNLIFCDKYVSEEDKLEVL